MRNRPILIARLLTVLATFGIAAQTLGYVFLLDDTNCVSTWPAGTIPMQVKLATTPTLTDGSNQRSSVLAAMAAWNVHLGTAQFAGTGAAPGVYGVGDGISEIVMDSAVEVEEERFPFDPFVLAVTISFEEANFVRESDIIINSNHQWDSFRGSQIGEKHDIRRVAAHELGHVLGLGHPNEANPPQYGAVLMHSEVLYGPSIEVPQGDDIAGAQALYGAPGFVPENDNLNSARAITLETFGQSAALHGTNVAATSEPGEPHLDVDDPGGRTVWWKWTATSSGIVTLTTAGSNFDTLLGAYSGASVSSLTPLALNDDVESGVIRHSAITFDADFGTTYYFAVDGWGGRVGTIQLNMSLALDPSRAPPRFTSRPFARNAIVGQPVVLEFDVESQFPVSFSWARNGVALPGQTTGNLSLPSAAPPDSGVFEVTATSAHGRTRALARLRVVHGDMTAVVWREGYSAASVVPSGMGSLLAVSAGGDHVLAVKADGTVVGWGDNYRRQLDVPAGLSDVVDVAAGTEFSLALRADGKVFAWGDVMHGGGETEARVIPPADLDEVISIAAHGKWAMALRADGSVVTWGEMVGFMPNDIGVAYAISAGPAHGHAIRRDGSVVSWGDYSGDGYPTPAGVGSLSAISAGGTLAAGHSVALRHDGTVTAWGYNYYGQTNVPAGLTDAVGVAAGGTFSLALRSDGKVIGWGTGFLGALEIPPELEEAVSISAGYNFGVALVRSRPPAIAINPADTVVQVGDTVSLTVGATGSRDLFYQWKKNGTNLTDSERMTGSLTDTLHIASALSGDTGDYLVEVTNLAGVAQSTPARLTVLSPPEITHRSPSRLVHEGEEVSFSVSVGGGGPFTFSWSHNRRRIQGATDSSILIGDATIADAGYYEVTITNSEGGASTGVFYLNVAIDEPSIVSWGNPPAATPTIGGPIAAISCDTFAMALKGDGTVVAWGDNGYGQTTVPAGLVDAVAVSAGSEFGIALKSDGTVLGWGRNDVGQATPPPGLGDVVAVSAGLNHALALKANGTVVAWGDPYEGNTVVPAGLRGVVAVEAGNNISYALKSDGTLVAWGFNGYLEPYPPAGLSDVVSVASGSSQHLALKSDGTVVTWGFAYGEDTSAPAGLSNVDAVAAGYGFDLALTSGGRVVAWGTNGYGEATPPEGLSTVVAISAGRNWGLALTRLEIPEILTQPPEVAVVTGDIAQLSVSVSGSIPMAFQWRKNGVILTDGNGISGATSATLWIDPVKGSDAGEYDVVISNPAGSLVSAPMILSVTLSPVFTIRPLSRLVAAGETVTFAALAIDTEDVHYQWRRNGRDLPGATSSSLTLSSVSYPDGGYYEIVASNSAAASRSVFHLEVGPVGGPGLSVAPWGEFPENGFGPTNVPSGLGDVVGLASGSRHSLALRADGTVAAWGQDSGGSTKSPPGLSDVVQVAVGEHHSLALLANGRVRSWGSFQGVSPLPIPRDLVDVVAIAVFQGANMALKSDGTIVTWGLTPPPVGLDDVIAIDIGVGGGIALKSDGTVATWAAGFAIHTPPPPSLSNVIAIAAGPYHGLALKSDGSVVGWGTNTDGQLNIPSGLSGVASISAGWFHSIALKRDGSLVAWGSNYYGQTGDRPDLVPSAATCAGQRHTLVLTKAVNEPTIITQPDRGWRVSEGEAFSIYAVARGVPAPSLQWFKDGVAMPGKTANFLTIQSVTASDSASYTLVASNPKGSVSSFASALIVVKRFVENVSQPRLDPPGGHFNNPKSVSMTCETPGATIRYTIDGSWPTRKRGTLYTGPFDVTSSMTVHTIAYADGLNDSIVSPAYFTIVIPSAPRITTIALPRAILGRNYQYQLNASGGDQSLTWAVHAGALPAGMSLDSSGKISGAPTSEGSGRLTIRVADNDQDVGPLDEDSREFALTVDPHDSVPTIQAMNLPRGIVGQPYSGELIGSGGNGNLVWTANIGQQHSGLSISPSGIVSGTPAQAGGISGTAWVGDSDIFFESSDQSSSFFMIHVDSEDEVPSITTAVLPDAGLSLAYSANLVGSGGNGALKWSLASGSLPPGLMLSEGGLISGIPLTLGKRTFTVRVGDDDTITGASDEATKEFSITVLPAPRLTNVSMRAFAGAGDDTLVVGFHIAGKGQKTVLIRGVGPKLLDYNVPNVVADPQITLYKDQTVLDTNNDWDSSLAPTFLNAGAFALDFGSKDAAMTATLAPGGYTIHLVNNGPVAEALVEVYDISRDAGTRLVNVSSRLRFRPGQLAILGTAVTGGPITVLARNVGPGIAEYLVNPLDALPDPHVKLYAGQTMMAENEDWDPALLPFFGSAGAFTIDEGSKDAAIRAQFQIGGYTVHSTGNGGQGVAIIEIYESP